MAADTRYLSIREVGTLLRNKEVTSQELTRSCLDLISSVDPQLHSFILVTDDLAMGAIRQFAENQRVCPEVLAVKAGNDLIMSENVDSGTAAIEQAIKDKQISQKQINQSVLRILKLKEKLGLLK